MKSLLLWVATLPVFTASCAIAPAPELLPQVRRSLPATERHVMVPTVATIGPVLPAAAPRHEQSIERLTLP